MIANSPLTDAVFDALGTTRPTVAYNYTVWQAQNGTSTREAIEQDIADLSKKENEKLEKIVASYLAENDKDSAITMLLLNNKIMDAIPLMISNNQHSSAQTLINTMPDVKLKYIYTFYNTLDGNGTSIDSISSSDSTILDSMAHFSDPAGKYAQGIMKRVYGKQYLLRLPTANAASGARKILPTINYTDILPDVNMYIYPNPATDILYILNSIMEPNITVEIYDAAARLLLTAKIETPLQTSNIDISNLKTGVYIIKIMNSQSKTVLNEKVVINPKR